MRIDAQIDERVLDLYGITNLADRQRILGSAPLDEAEEAAENNDEKVSSPEESEQFAHDSTLEYN